MTKGVLVASACMRDTMFHRLFTAQGIVFEPAKSLARDLRYHAHEHGERITIFYAGEEPWSKRYRDRKLDGQDATVLDQVKAAVGDLVGDEPFVWMGNTDLSDGSEPGVEPDPFHLTPVEGSGNVALTIDTKKLQFGRCMLEIALVWPV